MPRHYAGQDAGSCSSRPTVPISTLSKWYSPSSKHTCAGSAYDHLRGEAGNDTLEGGAGNDTLQGDFNADTFVFADGFGQDVITDFDAFSSYERIDLHGVSSIVNYSHLYHHRMVQSGDDVVIVAGQDRVTIENVTLEDLGSDDFLF